MGFNDIKSKRVYFYVQRRQNYGNHWTTIPWQTDILNIGSHMDLLLGIFTAPVNGIYHFSFNIMGSAGGPLEVILRKNMDEYVGRAYTERSRLSYSACALQLTINLKKDDKIDLILVSGLIYQDPFVGIVNHFTGWLIEEQLSLYR